MADAIPVTMDPEVAAAKAKRVVKVQASPSLNDNGDVVQGDYAAKQRDGLGDPENFSEGTARAVETQLTTATVDASGKVVGEQVHTHRAIRVDH